MEKISDNPLKFKTKLFSRFDLRPAYYGPPITDELLEEIMLKALPDVRGRRMIGCWGQLHHRIGEIKLWQATHLVTDLYLKDDPKFGKVLWCEVEILNTPSAKRIPGIDTGSWLILRPEGTYTTNEQNEIQDFTLTSISIVSWCN